MMSVSRQRDAVTGAFGYSGKYIARRLLTMGHDVITLTGHPNRPNPFGDAVRALPFNFDDPATLTRNLEGVNTLYNTYWIRFPHGQMTHEKAVENTETLFRAAREADVRRVVHVSITNPSEDSSLSYFRGKAALERYLIGSGLSYVILRPAVLFGGERGEDILVNNIAWLLRHFPFFVVMGKGDYGLQPIHVEDLAEIAVAAGQNGANTVIDAVGPEIYRYIDLVCLIREEVGSRAPIAHMPPALALAFSWIIGSFVGDVVITRDEVAGLMENLLISDREPTGRTRLSEWLRKNANQIGVRYASELRQHYRG
jgi:nucleoside-diphosphate-sugar epimerase